MILSNSGIDMEQNSWELLHLRRAEGSLHAAQHASQVHMVDIMTHLVHVA
jgi:hypothetical protein